MDSHISAASKIRLTGHVSWYVSMILISLILACSISAEETSNANVLIKAEVTQFLGGEFRVDIMVDSVSNLYGIAFDLHYDPDTLELVDADPNQEGIQPKFLEGLLLNNSGEDATIMKIALEDDIPGKLVIGLTRSGSVEGVSSVDEVISVSVFFRSKDVGAAEFLVSNHGLRDAQNQVIGDSKWDEIAVNIEDYDWMGDVNQSKSIDLEDVILVLKALSRQPDDSIFAGADINEDQKIGMEEAINPLQK